jgi:cytohesin
MEQTPDPAESQGQPRKPKKSLVKAVKDNNIALMDELIAGGSNLEEQGMWDNTPLLAACMYGKAEAAMRLIALRANVSARNEYGATPLHYAAVEGCQGVVEALLSAQASACRDGDEANQNLGSEDSPKLASEDSTKGFVNCGPARMYNRHLDSYTERSPLGAAAESGFGEIAAKLLAAGAELEQASEDGRTPAWLASRHNRLEALRFLMQQGADSNAKDSEGVSVLGAATGSHCNPDLVLALLGHGVANVNDTASSPLRQAVKARKRSVAEALLTHGASVQAHAADGKATALHAACEDGDEYLVSLLMRAGADPEDVDPTGRTAFDLLRRKGFLDSQIVSLLQAPSKGGPGGGQGTTGQTGTTGETGA